MIEQKPETKQEPQEKQFNVTFTQSELALIVTALAEDKDVQTFIAYHRGEPKFTIFKELKAVLDKGTQE